MMESQKPKRDEMDLEFLLRKKNQDDRKEETEWEPSQILCAIYNDPDNKHVLATIDGKYLGLLYVIDMTLERPVRGYKIPKGVQCKYIKYIGKYEILLLGFSDGSFEVKYINIPINNIIILVKN